MYSPPCTADGCYDYDTLICPTNGKRAKHLIELAGDMNSHIEKLNGWSGYKQWPPITRLGPGRWGTDINVYRITSALATTTKESPVDDIAEAVHNGWALCFLYWYENKPWKGENSQYTKPGKNLLKRDKLPRSKLAFNQLDDYQKKMCRQMAEFIRSECM